MDFFDNHYHKLNRMFLLVMGLWPYQSKKENYFRRIIVFSFLGSLAVTVMSAFFYSTWTIDLFAELIPQAMVTSIAVIHYLLWMFHPNQAQDLLEAIKHDWMTLPKAELSIVQDGAERGRLYTKNCACFLYLFSFVYVFSPLSTLLLDVIIPLNQSRSLHLPYKAMYSVDPQKYYVPILLHMYLSTTVIMTIVLGTQLMFITEVQHACGLFRIAGRLLKGALSERSRIYYGNYKAHRMLVQGVEYHKKAIMFVVRINEFYGWTNFMALSLFVISLTISLFCTVVFIGRWKEMLMNIICASSQSIVGFMLTYAGQQLYDESAYIFQNVYDSEWYAASLSSQKLVITIMQRSQLPSTLIVGKLFCFTFTFYGELIQTSMAYFTTLVSLR